MRKRLGAGVAIVLIVLAATIVQANPVPYIEMEWGANQWYSGDPGTMNVTATTDPSVFNYDGGYVGPDWSGTWSGWVDVDPAVNGAFAITNNTAVTQLFILTITLPTAGAISAPSSMLCGTTASVSGAGVVQTLSSPAADFLYRALASGSPAGAPCDILSAPFSLTTFAGGLPNSAGPFNFGPAAGPGLAAVDSIGIRYAFNITPGGTATVNGTFIVTPEPGTLALIVLGGMAIVRRRR